MSSGIITSINHFEKFEIYKIRFSKSQAYENQGSVKGQLTQKGPYRAANFRPAQCRDPGPKGLPG